MFLRAYRICSPCYLDDEILKVKEIFASLKYPLYVIDEAHIKARKTFYSQSSNGTFNTHNKRILCLPYSKHISKLAPIFRTSPYQVVFKYPSTIKSALLSNKPKSAPNSGVYTIPCKDCNKSYWGESGRNWEERLKEHKYDIRTCNMKNSLFNHIVNEDHRIDWDAAKLVYKCNDYYKRRIVESSLIGTMPNFNLGSGHFQFNKIIQRAVVGALGRGIT